MQPLWFLASCVWSFRYYLSIIVVIFKQLLGLGFKKCIFGMQKRINLMLSKMSFKIYDWKECDERILKKLIPKKNTQRTTKIYLRIDNSGSQPRK